MVEFFPGTPMYLERMVVALVYGCLIGLERQWQHGMAGMRTHGLVAVGGAAFVVGGLLIPGDPTAPSRVASYVVSGVGFLCAGAIFRDGATVKGLNTAATIWCAAAVGLLTGFGYFMLGLSMASLVMATNAILRPLAHRWHPWTKNQPVDAVYEIRVSCGEFIEEHIRTLLMTAISQAPVRLRAVRCVQIPASGQVELTVEVITEGEQPHEVERITNTLSLEPATRDIRWGLVPPAPAAGANAGEAARKCPEEVAPRGGVEKGEAA